MDNLSRQIQQAHRDAEQVHTTAQKITKRFNQIEQVDLPSLPDQNHRSETHTRTLEKDLTEY
jgi:hypothetical protein